MAVEVDTFLAKRQQEFGKCCKLAVDYDLIVLAWRFAVQVVNLTSNSALGIGHEVSLESDLMAGGRAKSS